MQRAELVSLWKLVVYNKCVTQRIYRGITTVPTLQNSCLTNWSTDKGVNEYKLEESELRKAIEIDLFSLGEPVTVSLSMAVQSFTNIKESNMVSKYFSFTCDCLKGIFSTCFSMDNTSTLHDDNTLPNGLGTLNKGVSF